MIFEGMAFWLLGMKSRELEDVVRSAGGEVVTKSDVKRNKGSVVAVVGNGVAAKRIREVKKEGVGVRGVEFIVESCLKQELDFDAGIIEK